MFSEPYVHIRLPEGFFLVYVALISIYEESSVVSLGNRYILWVSTCCSSQAVGFCNELARILWCLNLHIRADKRVKFHFMNISDVIRTLTPLPICI